MVASLLKTVGIDHVITVDLHSSQSEGFDMGVSNLDLTNLMKECMHQQPIDVILSPDIKMTRAKKMAEGLGRFWLVMQKDRSRPDLGMQVMGSVQGQHCLLIDDIMDSGATICVLPMHS